MKTSPSYWMLLKVTTEKQELAKLLICFDDFSQRNAPIQGILIVPITWWA